MYICTTREEHLPSGASSLGKYNGTVQAVFEEDSFETNTVLELKPNIRVKGTIKNSTGANSSAYRSIYLSGDNVSLNITADSKGNFKSPDIFEEGTYTIYVYPLDYRLNDTIVKTFEITSEDLDASIKELNLTAKEKIVQSKFNTGENGISASANIVAKGDTVTFKVKFQNDGNSTLNNASAYAVLPENVTVKACSGTINNDGTVSKSVTAFKADQTETLTFTLGTDDYNEGILNISAYVEVKGVKYPIGGVNVEIVNATLSAPKVVKENTPFKVSGEALPGSTVEIINKTTGQTLAYYRSYKQMVFC